MANKGQFYGVGRQKAGRRANRPSGSPRKVYAYTRKNQRGTPMEAFINGNYKELDSQRNATKPYPGEMAHNEALGNLQSDWQGVYKAGTSGRNLRNYMGKTGVDRGKAKAALVGIHTVSFGADPKTA